MLREAGKEKHKMPQAKNQAKAVNGANFVLTLVMILSKGKGMPRHDMQKIGGKRPQDNPSCHKISIVFLEERGKKAVSRET